MSDKETNTPATPTNSPAVNSDVRLTGRVKWFNNKAGYGFITVVSGENDRVGTDVFVHHSAVNVEKEQYRYLVQGEYVDFSWTVSNSKTHKYQAENVRGVKNGKLICETRNEVRAMQSEQGHDGHDTHVPADATQHNVRRPDNRQYRPRVNGPGPREGEEWMLVRRKRRNNNTNNDKRNYHNNNNNNNNDSNNDNVE